MNCGHKWQLVNDWIGDPNVIGGTQSLLYWQCSLCDLSTIEQPEDWVDPDEIMADIKRDRRIDDALTHERATTGIDRRHWTERNTNGFEGEDT